MKRRKRTIPSDLRRDAEARLRSRAEEAGPPSRADERRLVHELDVHRVELEIQNDALRTARRDTEAALERYVSLFDFAPLGYATLDSQGTIHEVNHSAARILGRSRSRLVGKPFEALVLLHDRPAFRMLLGRALASGLAEIAEVEVARSHAERFQARLIATVLPGAEGRVLLAFEDVTERKTRERRLAETEAALREVDRRKDEFLAVLSHELRNPLGALRNSAFLLSRATLAGAPREKAVAVIERQVSLLTRMVGDLLDVTRIARGKIELQRERLDLGDLLRRTLEDHRPSFEASGIALEVRPEVGRFWVEADAVRLVQVLSNLLGNAEKFTPRHGTVVVSLQRDDDRKIALRVRDSGVGIDANVLPHVFESFVQGPQTIDRARGGLGLGLPMVKGLVDLHGGSVIVSSKGQGRGTEVTILLPAAPAPEQAAAPALEADPSPARRVLVIDDNLDNAESLQMSLKLDGHDVRVAYDGPSGLDLARTFHPDVVVCDIGLPGLNGYDVARAFRADEALARIALIALSGYTRAEDAMRAAEAGFDRHLGKPVQVEELERLISEAAEGPRRQVEQTTPHQPP